MFLVGSLSAADTNTVNITITLNTNQIAYLRGAGKTNLVHIKADAERVFIEALNRRMTAANQGKEQEVLAKFRLLTEEQQQAVISNIETRK